VTEPPRARGLPSSARGLALLVVIATVAAVGAPLSLGTEALVASVYFYDDQFYYFQIARNVASGRGFTFDGLHPTNGFHPLWQVLLVPVFGLVSGDDAALRAAFALEMALLVAAAVLIFGALRPRIGEAPALVSALLIVAQPGATRVIGVGMESSLVLFLFVLTWRQWLALGQDGPAPPGRWLRLGICCALLFLARLEYGLVLPVVVVLARRRLMAQPRAAAALIAPVLACVAGYLAWNRLAFDTWLPVSAMVKARWGDALWVRPLSPVQKIAATLRLPWFGERLIRALSGVPSLSTEAPLLYLALLGLLLGGAWWLRARLIRAIKDGGAALVVLSSALIVCADKILIPVISEWQAVPIVLTTAVVGGALLASTPRLARLAAVAVLAACFARAPLAVWRAQDHDRTITYVIQAARWMRQNAATSDRFGSWAGGGILGYFSGRPVVILDGLANDVRYFRRVIVGGDLEGYLEEERIDWLAAPACGDRPPFSEGFPVQMSPAARDALGQRFEVAVTFHHPRHPCPGYVLWRRDRMGT
jgi:hypothetical protein